MVFRTSFVSKNALGHTFTISTQLDHTTEETQPFLVKEHWVEDTEEIAKIAFLCSAKTI